MKRPYRGSDAAHDGGGSFETLALMDQPPAADSERHEQNKGEHLAERRTKQVVRDDAALLFPSMPALFLELRNNPVGAARDNIVVAF
jgi:hypothetical protein